MVFLCFGDIWRLECWDLKMSYCSMAMNFFLDY
jgi:hypothetical protein